MYFPGYIPNGGSFSSRYFPSRGVFPREGGGTIFPREGMYSIFQGGKLLEPYSIPNLNIQYLIKNIHTS